jgi:hypothetical protein
MQTMTWTSPDTGVVDRPGAAPLVQEGLHLNSTVLLCPAASRGPTRGYPKGIITLRGPFATRSLTKVSGIRPAPRPDRPARHHPSSGACSRYCHGGREMFQIRYELDSSRRYQCPSLPSAFLRAHGYRTQCLPDGTAPAAAAVFAAGNRQGQLPFTDVNVIFAARQDGLQTGPAGRACRPLPAPVPAPRGHGSEPRFWVAGR